MQDYSARYHLDNDSHQNIMRHFLELHAGDSGNEDLLANIERPERDAVAGDYPLCALPDCRNRTSLPLSLQTLEDVGRQRARGGGVAIKDVCE